MDLTVAYAAGVFDLFHVGHLNLLRSAKGVCDRLVVGVSTDELVFLSKGIGSVVPFEDRAEIVRACRYVDVVVPQADLDKYAAWQRLQFDVLIAGDDWFGHERWQHYQDRLAEQGVKVIYFPYTQKISSTQIRQSLAAGKG